MSRYDSPHRSCSPWRFCCAHAAGLSTELPPPSGLSSWQRHGRSSGKSADNAFCPSRTVLNKKFKSKLSCKFDLHCIHNRHTKREDSCASLIVFASNGKEARDRGHRGEQLENMLPYLWGLKQMVLLVCPRHKCEIFTRLRQLCVATHSSLSILHKMRGKVKGCFAHACLWAVLLQSPPSS